MSVVPGTDHRGRLTPIGVIVFRIIGTALSNGDAKSIRDTLDGSSWTKTTYDDIVDVLLSAVLDMEVTPDADCVAKLLECMEVVAKWELDHSGRSRAVDQTRLTKRNGMDATSTVVLQMFIRARRGGTISDIPEAKLKQTTYSETANVLLHDLLIALQNGVVVPKDNLVCLRKSMDVMKCVCN